jgi:predicted P-loop ATPase
MTNNIIPLCNDAAVPEYPNYPQVRVNENGSTKVFNTSKNLAALCEYIGFKPALNRMNYSVLISPDLAPDIKSFKDLESVLISEASISGLPEKAIKSHLDSLCEKNSIHPVREWIEKESWDGVKRIDSVLKALNFREEKLSIEVMKHWLVSAIAALYEPIFSSKVIPILHGGQSWTKTAAIYRFCNIPSVQGTPFLSGKSINPNSRDSIQRSLSSWIVELGEFESTSKAENGALKAFFTEDADTVRYAYSSELVTKPRQTVFIGTVNESEFLTDKTGNRRYMVLPLAGPTDMDTINALLGWEFHSGSVRLIDESKIRQFWLEVKSLYDNGFGWVLPDEIANQAEELNQEYLVSDPLEDDFDALISFSSDDEKVPYTPSDICRLMKVNPHTNSSQLGKLLSSRFPNCKTRRRVNGEVKRVYLLPKIRLKRRRV